MALHPTPPQPPTLVLNKALFTCPILRSKLTLRSCRLLAIMAPKTHMALILDCGVVPQIQVKRIVNMDFEIVSVNRP